MLTWSLWHNDNITKMMVAKIHYVFPTWQPKKWKGKQHIADFIFDNFTVIIRCLKVMQKLI